VVKRTPFIRDEPIDLGEDAFGHRDYTDALVSIVGDNSPPPTVGLFGRWGVGKSTIIGGLQNELRSGPIAFVYFDAWRYDGDPLRRQFLIEAANQLKTEGALSSSYQPDTELNELHVDHQEIKESLGLSAARLGKAALTGLASTFFALLLFWIGVFDDVLSGNFGTEVLASVVAFAFGTFAGLFSQAIVVRPTTVSHKALQDPDRFAEKFADLLKALKPKRLVVAIDNLDRCSPENAVEILGTIKTYLEPTVSAEALPRSSARVHVDKEVVFVVSVDDAALRRHLLAQESARSRDGDEGVLRRYVDEYLAKFFSARLPIRPILPDDMRGYIAKHLAPMIAARELDEAVGRDLVSIVNAGFRRNPRAVKQFSNDLESRLRLLEEREREIDGRPPGISPPVSSEVLMVAKLALIEAEWPEAFELLVEEPRRLAGWEDAAESAEQVHWDQQTPIDEGGNQRGRDFAAFLRQARSVQTKQLAAILRLKQPEKEVTPGYSEFQAAAIGSDRAAVEEILEAAEKPEKLAAEMGAILDEELKAGFLVNARAVIDAAVTVPSLQPFDHARRGVLERAVRDFRLRAELELIDPTRLLDSLPLLKGQDRTNLLEVVIGRLTSEEEETVSDPESRRAAGAALAGVASQLSESQREKIRHGIAFDLTDFPTYRPLIEADARLMPAGVAAAAIAAPVGSADSPEEEEHHTLLGAENAFAVAIIAFLSESDPEAEAAAVDHAISVLIQRASNAELGAEIEAASALLEPFEGVDEGRWSTLLQGIGERWHQHPVETQPALMAFIDKFIGRAGEEVREALPRQVANLLFEDPNHGVSVCAGLEEVPEAFREPLIERLREVPAENPGLATEAIDALAAVVGASFAAELANVVVGMIAAGHFVEALSALSREEEILLPELTGIADRAVPVFIGRFKANEGVDGELFAKLTMELSEEQEAELVSAMVAQLQAGTGVGVLDASEELRRRGSKAFLGTFAEAALEALLGLGEIGPPNSELLAAVCRHVRFLDSDDQVRLAEKLAAWLSVQPGQAALLAGNIETAEGLRAEPARVLVEALVGAERATGIEQVDLRQQLLAAAFAIRGNRGTRSRRTVRKRIEELREGNDFEREMATRFEDVED
jgi:hypothetical protein